MPGVLAHHGSTASFSLYALLFIFDEIKDNFLAVIIHPSKTIWRGYYFICVVGWL